MDYLQKLQSQESGLVLMLGNQCSGTMPCASCVSSGEHCVYNGTSYRRRTTALSRKVDELSLYKWAFEGLLISLRNSRDHNFIRVLEQIYDESSMQDLTITISSSLATTEVPEAIQSMVADVKSELEDVIHRNAKQEGRRPKGSIRKRRSIRVREISGGPSNHPSSFPGGLESCSPMQRIKHEVGSPRIPEATAPGNLVLDISSEHEARTLQQGQMRAASGLGLGEVIRYLNEFQNPRIDQSVDGRPCDLNDGRAVDSRLGTQALFSFVSKESFDKDRVTFSADDCSHHEARRRSHPPMTVAPPRTAPFTHAPVEDQSTYPSLSRDAAEPQLLSSASSTFNDCHDMSPSVHSRRHRWTDIPPSVSWPASSMALPRLEPNARPMAKAITDYLKLARNLLSQGCPVDDILGPERPYVDLLFRRRRQSDSHSACHFAAELCTMLEEMEWASRLALSVMFTFLIRWMISPSEENYLKIPQLYRPTSAQINIPHSADIELCPIPHLREALCHRNWYFFPALVSTTTCNWPNPSMDSCTEWVYEDDAHSVLTADFIMHAMHLQNWTVGPGIIDMSPEIQGTFGTEG
ncbi:hypothetical protein H2204_010302 [Knufia peltigerae]|uniref:Uncharacterized protein n=1 Tax=Knufia peltigerae TaxID=1002370 RepID=A0AA39CV02_9EURO|nr:hypothetical protein H2204_010302 [Knufia peltigerae]